jgi:hypothetical protein
LFAGYYRHLPWKESTIISASIPKYVDGIRGCITQAFPGATIGRITELLFRGKINISNIDIVIIHVGTNNISSAQHVDTIISYYGDLIHKVKYKTNAHIVCTSILPRLCDHDKTVNKINKVNLELKKLCIRKKIQYTNLYRSFFIK